MRRLGIGGRYGRDEMVYRLMPGKRPRFCDQPVFAFLYSYLRALRERNGTDFLSFRMGCRTFGRVFCSFFFCKQKTAYEIYLYNRGYIRRNGNVSFVFGQAVVYAKQTEIV